MGTPVIFLNGGFTHMMDHTRFDGITHLLNKIDIDIVGKTSANFDVKLPIGIEDLIVNPPKPIDIITNLESKAKKFINENS